MSSGYKLELHEMVIRRDIPRLDNSIRKQVRKVIRNKLLSHPEFYGKRLRGKLKNCWKLRVDNYRVVYKFNSKKAFVYAIDHRSTVYKTAEERI